MHNFSLPEYTPLLLIHKKLLYLFMLYYNVWTFSARLQDNTIVTLVPGGLDNPLIPLLHSDPAILSFIRQINEEIECEGLTDALDAIIWQLRVKHQDLIKYLDLSIAKITETESLPMSLSELYSRFAINMQASRGRCEHDIFREFHTKLSKLDGKFILAKNAKSEIQHVCYTKAQDITDVLSDSKYEVTISVETLKKDYLTAIENQLQLTKCIIKQDIFNVLGNESNLEDGKDMKSNIASVSANISELVFQPQSEPAEITYRTTLERHDKTKLHFSVSQHQIDAIHSIFKNAVVTEDCKRICKLAVKRKTEVFDVVTYDLTSVYYVHPIISIHNLIYGNITDFPIFLRSSLVEVVRKKQIEELTEKRMNDFFEKMTPSQLRPTIEKVLSIPQNDDCFFHKVSLKLMNILLSQKLSVDQKVNQIHDAKLDRMFVEFTKAIYPIAPLSILRAYAIICAPTDVQHNSFGQNFGPITILFKTDTVENLVKKPVRDSNPTWVKGFKLAMYQMRNAPHVYEKYTDDDYYKPMVSFLHSFISESNGYMFKTKPLAALKEYIPLKTLNSVITRIWPETDSTAADLAATLERPMSELYK